jgi:hypothetical protein
MSNRERGPRFEAVFAELVQGLGSESDDEAVAAMLLEVRSLERCLSRVEADHSRYPDIEESLRRTNPTSTLERLAASELETDHLSECLPRDLRSALELVGHYLGRGGAQASPHHTQ